MQSNLPKIVPYYLVFICILSTVFIKQINTIFYLFLSLWLPIHLYLILKTIKAYKSTTGYQKANFLKQHGNIMKQLQISVVLFIAFAIISFLIKF